ncbi:vacuolar fusion protein MON1 homolog A [Condylostylus longicornis]|uniref:vacuolar fusion protein MON1 homolog A n=1 Tax=Condylostylus longicornis TaxID=2530218 RepID=UPI00244E035B|nr:vacuolar fusion protein MON1 homolog A [Condylostylus longicornis]
MENAEVEISTPGSSENPFEDSIDHPYENEDISDNEAEDQKHSIIQDIREEINVNQMALLTPTSAVTDGVTKSESFSSNRSKDLTSSTENLLDDSASGSSQYSTADEYYIDKEWLMQKKHVFILSDAGKPIYSLHGSEDKLASIFGIMQALVSFVQGSNDAIQSIHANGIKFVFMVRNSLILVAASRSKLSVHQMQMQLNDVYNQILSILTYSHMTKIFEKRKNFDLRRLLAGSERLIDHLLVNDSSNRKISNNVFTFLTNSIRVLPMSASVRSSITSAIQSNCSKIQNLVFAVLIANNKLICLVRMKKYFIHPADLRLIFNLIECSESFKTAESWTPICLPKFDMNGFLHAHVSYLADDCQACLLLLSVDRDVFFTLSEAKKKITEKLRRSHCLEVINLQINNKGVNLASAGIPELRHFLYKPKSTAQLLCSEITAPYSSISEFERLEAIYCKLHHRIHNLSMPLKLIYEVKEKEVILAWETAEYELYATFEPTVDKSLVIKLVNKLLKWIEKDEENFFIKYHPTF